MLLVLKLYPIQVVISLPLWIKLATDQLLLFFLWHLCSFFSYIGGVLVTKVSSLLLIDRYILTVQQIVTYEEQLRYSFWSVAILWTASEALASYSQQQKVVKTPSKLFSLSNSSQKPPFFSVLIYALYGHSRSFKFELKNQQYGPCFQTIFQFIMTMLTCICSTRNISGITMSHTNELLKYLPKTTSAFEQILSW